MDSKTRPRLRDTRTATAMGCAEYLESPLLRAAGFRHAFFTRRGGVSAGAYESLNFSFAVGDAVGRVRENFVRAAAALGVAPGRMYCLAQRHGAGVCELSGKEDWDKLLNTPGDAVVGRHSDLACCVRIADCVPVLIANCTSGAAAAVHAGWRGTVAQVVGAAVARLTATSEDDAALIAAIGPHISQAAFEVSEQVAVELEAASPARGVALRRHGCRPRVSLRQIIRAQLHRAGLDRAHIDDVPGCTVHQPELFFSFRRDGRSSGRHLAAIIPRSGASTGTSFL